MRSEMIGSRSRFPHADLHELGSSAVFENFFQTADVIALDVVLYMGG